MRVLVVNAGSSSLKLRLLDPDDAVAASVDIDGWDGRDAGPIRRLVAEHGGIDAVGHRVVHGGAEFATPVVVDDRVAARIEALTELAPLHQPRALAGLSAARTALPAAVQVACFDTAFHADLPAAAATYALPAAWRDRYRLRRYGFHGLSHAYAAGRAGDLLGRSVDDVRLVTCHLGAGASLAAVEAGRSVDTTMGFTPLEGLVMATRSGSVDPGLLLWLIERHGMAAGEVTEALEHASGLAGLAGGSGDMREILRRAGTGDAAAQLALAVYVHRLRAGIAAMAAAMGGLDALVFTGGIGEHRPVVRAAACERLGFLGVVLDPSRNTGVTGDGDIGAPGAAVRALVVTAREDIEIGRQTRQALNPALGRAAPEHPVGAAYP